MQTKSRLVTILIILFLGAIGIHRFYLNQNTYGLAMLLFFWTGIPLVIAIIDFIGFLLMSDESFDDKYNNILKDKRHPDSEMSVEDQMKLLNYDLNEGNITRTQYKLKKAEIERKLNA